MWLPGDDAVGHYRSTFCYDLLYDVWNKIGRPNDQLIVGRSHCHESATGIRERRGV
jgi:hypothetical protein